MSISIYGALLAFGIALQHGPAISAPTPASTPTSTPSGKDAPCRVTDGDTLRCGERRIRLYGIDAPELPGHCRRGRRCTPGDPHASSDHLRRLISGTRLSCQTLAIDRYGRDIARCTAGGVDLSCAQVASGHAVRRYGHLSCT